MTPSPRRREVPRFAALVLLCSLFTPLLATELLHDFDGDGRDEKLVSTPTSSHIEQRNEEGAWERADYALPEGLSPMDAAGGDSGLRFVDLNGDGFDDILFCNDEKLVIHLWNTTVKPALGWTKGWSQKVRAETKKDSAEILPSLVEKNVRAEGGDLIVEGVSEKWKLRDLIAFDLPKPLSPEEALEAFTVRPGFEVELVASEPVVVDPVAMNWDEGGNLWVVEMRDYPLGIDGKGKPGGVIKKLQDRDGDGHYEDSTLFLEGVTYPTGVFPWRKGVLYTATPDIVYAEDTDGDGRAETREVLFTGFRPGNQQHLVNGFEWGLDGWIYVANGDSGGTVKSLQTGKELSIRGRDFRFKPDTGEMETVSAQTQFGLRRDDWGNWFGNNNSIWLWHVVMPEHYLRRNPKLAVKGVRRTIADYPEATRVFPTSSAIERPNQPWSLNHVTSACSPVLYRDDFFGADFARTAWISEPVHNLIHREVLVPEGVSFRSERAAGEERSEFLSSSDHWFRPTGLSIGPDGCLYIADMYRFVIEHPEWISPEMQSRIDLRAGEDKGRIYRVKPAGKARRPIPHLADLPAVELVRAMNSASGWQRDTAMRLLKNRSSPEGIAELKALTRPPHAPQVRVQALATLGYLEALTEDHLVEGLSDPHSEMKIAALRQTDSYLPKSDRLFQAMTALAHDRAETVRRQLAFSLGEWPEDRALPVLQILTQTAGEEIRLAVQSSLSPDAKLFQQLQAAHADAGAEAIDLGLKPSSPDRAAVIAKYAALSELKGKPEQGKVLFQTLCAICHSFRGEGQTLGPDLGMTSTKPVDWLLHAILDPNQIVESRYQAWNVTTTSGQSVVGIITTETVNNLLVKLPGGAEQAVLRDEVAKQEPLSVSLMPTGFESTLPPQGMADLIEYLRSKGS